jgi:hypothetical protein
MYTEARIVQLSLIVNNAPSPRAVRIIKFGEINKLAASIII